MAHRMYCRSTICIMQEIYIHGLKAWTKAENIKKDNRICIEVCEFKSLIKDDLEILCDIDAEYESVVVAGHANEIEDADKKRRDIWRVHLGISDKNDFQ